MRWFARLFVNPAASTDGAEKAWAELEDARVHKRGAWAPRGVCDRVKRWATTVAVPFAMLAACDVAGDACGGRGRAGVRRAGGGVV